MPLRLSQDVDQVGAEISAADGWTDLASYINAPLMRLDFSSDSDFSSKESIQALRSILQYMVDTERRISIRFVQSLRNIWADITKDFEPDALDKIGEHIVFDAEDTGIEQCFLPVMSVEKEIAVFDESNLELLQKLQDESPHHAPYLIACFV